MANEKETATIFIPEDERDESNQVFVSVNGRNFSIRRGESVEVPVEVQQALLISDHAKRDASAFKRKQQALSRKKDG